jgi:hypothetical protein
MWLVATLKGGGAVSFQGGGGGANAPPPTLTIPYRENKGIVVALLEVTILL